MANPEHLKILKNGVEAWNKWREENPQIRPDLVGADLRGADFSRHEIDLRQGTGKFLHRLQVQRSRNINPADFGLDLHNADLSGARFNETNLSRAYLSKSVLKRAKFTHANLRMADFFESDLTGALLAEADLRDANLGLSNLCKANLKEANLRGAQLTKAKMQGAVLTWADLRKAHLDQADLTDADLSHANLTGSILWGATLTGADLTQSQMVRTELADAQMVGCRVFGTSVWRVGLRGATQKELIISPADEAQITVDNLEVAQFIYLLLKNEKIRNVIDTITSKVVLILGRFSKDRKSLLDQLRDALREGGLAPVLFDFEKPASKDITGTVETLARMARFIVADLTDPRSIPHELATIVPFMRTTPIVPIRLKGSGGYSMFDDFDAYKWVLPKYEYESDQILITTVSEKIIEPAETKVKELRGS